MARLVSTSFRQIRKLNSSSYQNLAEAMAKSLKIAVIGQSVFARDVYNLIKKNGHTIVGVFTIPDKNGREVENLNIDIKTGLVQTSLFWAQVSFKVTRYIKLKKGSDFGLVQLSN